MESFQSNLKRILSAVIDYITYKGDLNEYFEIMFNGINN